MQVGLWEKFVRLTHHGAKIVFKTPHGRYLTAQEDGTITGDAVTVSGWQIFHERYYPENGTVSIETWQQKYITAFPNGSLKAVVDKIGPWQRFKEEAHADGTVSLLSPAHNRYVCAVTFNSSSADADGMKQEFEKV
jgi:hypothetical protein